MTAKSQEKDENKDGYGKSKGEKLFDWLTYGGIAGLGTFLVTIPITYWAKYGGGAKYFSQATKWLEKKRVSTNTAEDAVMTTALMQGGNLMLLPVKIMENYKPQLVEKFNAILGEPDDIETVKHEPKQTWGSIIKARLLAWGAVFAGFRGAASLLGSDKFAAFENWFSKTLVCKPFGQATHLSGRETKWFRYGKIAALDVFATAAAATLLYVGTRIFAKKEAGKEKEESIIQAAEIPPTEAPSEPSRSFTTTIKPCAPCLLNERMTSASKGEQVLANRKNESQAQLAAG